MSAIERQDVLNVGMDPLGIAGAGEDILLADAITTDAEDWQEADLIGPARVGADIAAPWGSIDAVEGIRPASGFSRVALTTLPLIGGDLLALCVCGIFAAASMRIFSPELAQHIGWKALVALFPLALAYWPGGLYPGIGIHPVIELRQLTKLNAIVFAAALAGCFLTRSSPAWVAFFSISWLASLPLVPLARSWTRSSFSRRPWWGCPALVISSGIATDRVIHRLRKHAGCGLRPVGVADPTARHHGTVEGVPHVNHPAAITALICEEGVRYGIVALPDLRRGEAMEIIDRYSTQIPHLVVLSNCSELPSLWTTPRSFGSLNGTEVRNGLMLAGPRIAKRAIDVIVTSAALMLFLPLLAAVFLLVRLTSKGPALFSHSRIGHGGRVMQIWKFRTMHIDGDEILEKHLKGNARARDEWARDQKLRDDPRVTPIGGFLRKFSLDELPQLWNVLRGDMSLVGPRPIVREETAKYGEFFRLYGYVAPGITGLWQVSGRNNTTYAERVQLDTFYVRNWSPWLDVYILMRTVRTVMLREGAY